MSTVSPRTPYDEEIASVLADLNLLPTDVSSESTSTKLDALMDQRAGYLEAKMDDDDLLTALRGLCEVAGQLELPEAWGRRDREFWTITLEDARAAIAKHQLRR